MYAYITGFFGSSTGSFGLGAKEGRVFWKKREETLEVCWVVWGSATEVGVRTSA